jgi:lipopolysaccharide transport system ATP-binding protein
MSSLAVRVDGLAKSFRLRHQLAYYRFSEFIENVVRNAVRLPQRILRPQPTGAAAVESDVLWALDDVSFDVPQGEVLGIIGRNGAGKSTLLKLLTRITAPTRGRIEIRGRVGSLLEVGTGMHPELTGRENIFLNGAIIGMSQRDIRRKFDEIVAFSEVERFLETPVKHYSSGMQMRLAFSVAAHLEPEILIIDEVLAVGDAAFQQKCIGKVGAASRLGETVLLVSHNLPMIANLCHRAILLDAGRIVALGAPGDIVKLYLSRIRSAAGEVVWPSPETAPGTDAVRLHAVRVIQDDAAGPTADVDIAREISIQIEYWNQVPEQQLYSALWLKDGNGTFVLATSNVTAVSSIDDPWYGKPQPEGLYRATCTLPANFLNDARYVVSAIVGQVPGKTVILEESVLTFNVHDTGAMREEYFGHWAGPVIRPQLPWNTVRQS